MPEGNHEKKSNEGGQNRDLNSELTEYESSLMNFDRRCVLCTQSFSIDAFHSLRELELEPPSSTVATMLNHATSLLCHVHAIASRNKSFTSSGTSEKLTLWTPLMLLLVMGLMV